MRSDQVDQIKSSRGYQWRESGFIWDAGGSLANSRRLLLVMAGGNERMCAVKLFYLSQCLRFPTGVFDYIIDASLASFETLKTLKMFTHVSLPEATRVGQEIGDVHQPYRLGVPQYTGWTWRGAGGCIIVLYDYDILFDWPILCLE